MYPIKRKPKSILSPTPEYVDYNTIIEIPNMISREMAENLKKYAVDETASGLHRRTPNTKDGVSGFYTCQVHETMDIHGYDNGVYELLQDAWTLNAQKTNYEILYIEPYEIKMYKEGDCFDVHHDGCLNFEETEERKMNLIIQLADTDDYVGGDLYVEDHHVSRTFGTGVFFPSNYMHRVTRLESGTRTCLIGRSWQAYEGPEVEKRRPWGQRKGETGPEVQSL